MILLYQHDKNTLYLNGRIQVIREIRLCDSVEWNFTFILCFILSFFFGFFYLTRTQKIRPDTNTNVHVNILWNDIPWKLKMCNSQTGFMD